MRRDSDNFTEVRASANHLAKKTGEVYYVIHENDYNGSFHAVNDTDLNTFYAGNNRILYCSADRD